MQAPTIRSSLRTALLASLLTACGTSEETAPDAPRAPDAQIATDAPGTVAETGMVSSNSGTPLEGAQVCIPHHQDVLCGTTDSTGNYAMTVPRGMGRFTVNGTAPGYLGSLSLDQANPDVVIWPSGMPLYSITEAMQRFGTDAGFTVPTNGTGIVEIRLGGSTAGSLTGVTATLAPTSTARPVYLDAQGKPDPSLTGTTSSNAVLFGNLAPGTYTVTASAPGKTCSVLSHGSPIAGDWAPAGSGTTDFEIAADSLTRGIAIVCQ